jgi:hypothetical protein
VTEPIRRRSATSGLAVAPKGKAPITESERILGRQQGAPLRPIRSHPGHHPLGRCSASGDCDPKRVLLVASPRRRGPDRLRRTGIGFVPHSPIGTRLLTGMIDTSATFEYGDDRRPSIPRFSAEVRAQPDYGRPRPRGRRQQGWYPRPGDVGVAVGPVAEDRHHPGHLEGAPHGGKHRSRRPLLTEAEANETHSLSLGQDQFLTQLVRRRVH